MFFIVVYIHMARGLYYGSYRAPRVMLWSVGVFIFLLMMGQLSLNEYEFGDNSYLSKILIISVNGAGKVKPVRSYLNADLDKKEVYEENKKKSGVYCWTNKKNEKRYVGSSVDLSRRFGVYYNLIKVMKSKSGNSYIYSALLKEGYSGFRLDILEYCDKEKIIEREQYYMDLMKPEYNILRYSRSRLGYKESEEFKLKHRARKRANMLEINKKKGIGVEVLNTETKEVKLYGSMREAARGIGCVHNTISKAEKVLREEGIEKLINGRYIIVRKK